MGVRDRGGFLSAEAPARISHNCYRGPATHRVEGLACGGGVPIRPRPLHNVAVQQGGVQVGNGHVPDVACAVGGGVQRHLVGVAAGHQVCLCEQAQHNASGVGREERKVGGALEDEREGRR